MSFDAKELIGAWENFENYFTDTDPMMKKAWEDAEIAVRTKKKNIVSMVLFRNGAKQFWMDNCYTVTKENKSQIGSWDVFQSPENKIAIKWVDKLGKEMGTYDYRVDSVLESGLEGKPNLLLCSEDAPKNCPFRYLLCMEPFPGRDAKASGGMLSHLHFQFSSEKNKLLKRNGKLKRPHWYATMCDADATMLQRCNIVRALHQLPIEETTDL